MESHFVDYFAICGLDTKGGLELEHFTSKNQGASASTPLERSYVAKLLAHYPNNRSDQPFSQEILALCLPKGLRFCTQKEVPAEPAFHTFACIKADGSRIDGSVLTFYEEVADSTLCQAMQYLHSMHLRELTSGRNGQQNGEDSGLKPPRPDERSTSKGGSNTLPRRGRSNKSKRTSFYDSTKDKLFATKCICMLTKLPVVGACESVLRSLYNLSAQNEPPPLPLESYVYWLLYEVPLPPPGRSLKLTMLNTDVICQRPGIYELPFFDYSLRELFSLIPIDKFLKIYTCILLEHQILICSKVLQRLMLLAESLTSLLFPFRWQHVYVPILPYSQFMFLEAPLPFVMGLWIEDNIPEEVVQSNLCLVDIDTGGLQLPEDVPALPDRAELIQELYFIFDKYGYHLMNNGTASIERSTAPPETQQQNARGVDGRRNSRRQEYQLKRMSRSFDEDSIHASAVSDGNAVHTPSVDGANYHQPPPSRSQLPPLPLNVLHESEPLARLTALARKAGVDITLEHLQQELESSANFRNSPSCRHYFEEMKLNNAIREVFMNRFVYMLFSYDHFIIGNYRDKDTFANNRDSMQNFDKASFLSDQPESHLPFLSAFIETQMFASFVDNKILSQWETPDPFLELFDRRLQELRERYGDAMVRTPTYEACPSFALTEDLINKREESLDYEVMRPHALIDESSDCKDRAPSSSIHIPGFFPILDAEILGRPPATSPQKSPWKQRYKNLRRVENAVNDKYLANSSSAAKSYRTQNMAGVDLRAAEVAQTNWKFVDQLLREAKGKTKRMLVEKMGKEAVELGHADLSITGVEENTLVASLCDLVERVWTHGLIKKKGKSALWTHLLAMQELEKAAEDGKPPNPTYLTPEEDKKEHPVLSYLQGLQKEMGADSAPWSTNLLKAATYICDKLQTATPPSTQTSAQNLFFSSLNNNSSSTPSNGGGAGGGGLISRLRRTGSSVSLSDFSPWTNYGPESNRNDNSREQSPAVHQYQQNSYNANSANGADQQQQQQTSPRKRSLSRPRSPDMGQTLKPLSTHIAYDMRNVVKMTEIKTDIGFARAFVRLALERKLLHKHLKTLLSNHDLLRGLYKRYAFLRCEDEREQFLCHILSLNAADFHCFTNTFGRTKMAYQVIVVPGGGRFTFGSAQPNIWIRVGGTLGQTGSISLTKSSLILTFEHKNLGILSTMRIGHDTTAPGASSAKWFLEHVIIRNEITGRAYKFPCARWFGRGVDDGSLERLLVAEPMANAEVQEGSRGWRTPPRSRSPSAPRRGSSVEGSRSRFNELQHNLGEAVNNIVKHFYKSEKDRSHLTPLLCGDRGLIWCLEQAFLMGFRTSRLFRQVYPWDFIEKFALWCSELLREHAEALSDENKKIMRYCRLLVTKINTNTVVGKDGKFQVFVLIAIKDHTLPALVSLMSSSAVTQTMYDEPSFLRTPQYRLYLTQLLSSLNEFKFELEKSLTWGIDT